jgi:hypothetical protein
MTLPARCDRDCEAAHTNGKLCLWSGYFASASIGAPCECDPPAYERRLCHHGDAEAAVVRPDREKQTNVDRRKVSLTLTEKGATLLRNLAPFQREINDVEFGSLTREQFETLLKILTELIECGDKAVALQRYKSSVNDSTLV